MVKSDPISLKILYDKLYLKYGSQGSIKLNLFEEI